MDQLSLALLSLDGLSIGDAFGQCFFQPEYAEKVGSQVLPEAPWYFTDDTEMSLSVVAILAKYGAIHQGDLADSLARHYDYERAYGPSMHRVLERISWGEDWREVAGSTFEGQGSWGNGAAMRTAPLGAYFSADLRIVQEQATLSAEVTHAHPEGVVGAVAVALAAAHAIRMAGATTRPAPKDFLAAVIADLPQSEVRSKLVRAQSITGASSLQFAVSVLGNGIGMSAQDTVPFALWCCAQHLESFTDALWLAVNGGGDRDTICAIVGGVVAGFVGAAGLPAEWRRRREPLPLWHLQSCEPVASQPL
ncbi:MAG: ADP-ribosylglycohydrolase family protein [Massilia sp.]